MHHGQKSAAVRIVGRRVTLHARKPDIGDVVLVRHNGRRYVGLQRKSHILLPSGNHRNDECEVLGVLATPSS